MYLCAYMYVSQSNVAYSYRGIIQVYITCRLYVCMHVRMYALTHAYMYVFIFCFQNKTILTEYYRTLWYGYNMESGLPVSTFIVLLIN